MLQSLANKSYISYVILCLDITRLFGMAKYGTNPIEDLHKLMFVEILDYDGKCLSGEMSTQSGILVFEDVALCYLFSFKKLTTKAVQKLVCLTNFLKTCIYDRKIVKFQISYYYYRYCFTSNSQKKRNGFFFITDQSSLNQCMKYMRGIVILY